MERIIFHIDVNSAYLSWTAIDRLSKGDTVDLRLIPSIVGGDKEKRHGIVLAKSIPAKKFNIITGEPIVKALEKCSALTIAAPDHHMYKEKSRMLMDYLKTLTPDIEQVSIDECYLDFTSIVHMYPSPVEAATLIKDTIYEKMGFTVNVGISDRKVLAKMASDFKKPNLVHTLYHHEIEEKMWPLPVSSLFMCGKSSVEELRKLEILTIGDLAKADPDIISLHLKSHGRMLWEFANGIDASEVEPIRPDAKGVGNSTTLAHDAEDLTEIHEVLLALSDSVGKRLRKTDTLAYMVSVEVKYNTFVKNSHQTTLISPTNTSDTIYQTACRLFDELWDGTPVRLLGIRTSKLVDTAAPVQMNLLDYMAQTTAPTETTPATAKLQYTEARFRTEKNKKLDAALDSIRSRYGTSAVVRGSMLNTKREFKE